ncbi:MAG: alpha/beta fold hydrolase [Promethearchaeota archaeon]
MPYLNYSNKKIFYQIKENDNNNAIIFVHGSGGSSNDWKNQFSLKTNYNIITLDLPSHNKSEYFSELSLDLYVNILNELIHHLNIEDAVLCGHSLGGAIIQAYYLNYPKKVKALILCGTGGRLRVNPNILDALKSDYQKYLDSLSLAFHEKTSKEIIDIYRAETSKVAPQVTYQDFKICDAFDTLDKTHTIELPCLILCGDSDYLTPPKYSKYFKEKIKRSQLFIIEKAGHMLMLEKPKEVNLIIETFLNDELN